MPRINIDGDRLYLDNDLIGRIVPSAKLIAIREFESIIGHGNVHVSTPDAAELKKETNDVLLDFMSKVRQFAETTRSGGLLTIREIEDCLDEVL